MARRRLVWGAGTWGLDRIDQAGPALDGLYRHTRSGAGVDVYLLDTGIDPTHPDLDADRVRMLHDWRATLPPGDPRWIAPSDPRFGRDDHGHGTAVASLVGGDTAGAAPRANLVSVKAFDHAGGTDAGRLDAALAAVEADHAAKGPTDPPSILLIAFRHPALADPPVRPRFDSLVTAGVLVVVAVGDEGTLFDGTPLADLTAALRVGVLAPGDRFAVGPRPLDALPSLTGPGPSNHGIAIDLLAPGIDLRAARLLDGGFGLYRGSGGAAALTAGIAALHFEDDPSATAADVRSRILTDARRTSIIDLPADTTDRVLLSRFTDAVVRFETLPTPWIAGYEGNWVEAQLPLRVVDPVLEPLAWTLTVTAGSPPAGTVLLANGTLRGLLPSITPFDPGYVSVSGLPVDEREFWRARGVQGWVDFAFDVTVDALGRSDTATVTVRVYDRDAPPSWIVDGVYDLGIIVDNDSGGLLPIDLVPFTTEPTGASLTFTLLSGTLPPGLILDPAGQITGSPAPVPRDRTLDPSTPIVRVFDFVVRASDGLWSTDLACRLTVERTAAYNASPSWVTPDWSTSLGTVTVGHVVSLPLDAVDPDGDQLDHTLITPITDPAVPPPGPGVNHGLPPGLGVDLDGRLQGVVQVGAAPGTWYFQVRADDGFGGVDRVFRIDVREPDRAQLAGLGVIRLLTPAGLLATLEETEPCWAAPRVEATGTVSWDVDPATPLPPGLTLDADSGEIRGRAPWVTADTTWTVRVRARLVDHPTQVVERDYDITVIDRWSDPVTEVTMQVTGWDRDNLRLPWMGDEAIVVSHLFRPDDDLFGFELQPEILVCGAFAGVTTADVWAALDLESGSYVEPPPAWGRVSRFVLGPPATAVARDPATGTVVYEVLYHPVIDPAARAGGFDGSGAPSPVPYAPAPKTGTDPLNTPPGSGTKRGIDYLYPPSIGNLRRGLLWDLAGFVVTERLPLWMRSEQVAGDPATVLGWFPAVTVAYLAPGSGERFLAAWATRPSVAATVGRVLEIGQLIVRTYTDPNAPDEVTIPLWASDPRR